MTDPKAPLARIQQLVDESAAHLRNYTRPVFLLGLYPGHELLSIFQASEQDATPHCPQPIWICLDSTIIFFGLLNALDLTPLIASPRVRFFWYEEAEEQVVWLREHPEFPHLFTLISAASESTLNQVMPPFAELIQERDQETEHLKEDNNRYYDAISDEQLALILRGEAERSPRLMMPTCLWSTFVQYSTRDTCRAFREQGWDVCELKMEAMLTPFYLAQAIHQFKPDVFLFIDHMRYEAEEIYPRRMLFVTWIQDEMDHMFCRSAGESMTRYAQRGRRDLVIGYGNQQLATLYGYPADRLVMLPVTADTRVFHPVTLSSADQSRYTCELAFMSNTGLPTDRLVEERIVPQVESLGISRATVEAIHDRLWKIHREGQTQCYRRHFLELLCEYDECRAALERLREEGEDERLLRLFYWKLNDAIYRHVVIEWADQAGLDIHLYGHGWSEHPRFARYAHGNVEHGEELNKAYQGARWNLHLNITQGMHQRVWEILAAGATPLFRATEPIQNNNEPPITLLRSWADAVAAGRPMDLNPPDENTTQWLFQRALSLAETHPEATPEELQKQLTEYLRHLVTSRPDIVVEEWDQLSFNDAESLARLVGSTPPSKLHLHA
ncbi:MAG: hypothetical protein PHG65_02970 [Kiritimatiellae bacterium]|nr:hypothetical protein [Kiritimatiellia bacterium]